MTDITVQGDNSIDTVISALINKAVQTGHSQYLIANFTDRKQLRSPSFAGVGYSAGDTYDIRFVVQDGRSRREITVDYIIEENGEGLVGSFRDHTRNEEISSVKLGSSQPITITLKEIGFNPKDGRREVLYDEDIHHTRYSIMKAKPHSKYVDIAINLIDDARFVIGTLSSSEASLKRYRRGSVAPWFTVGIPVSIATSVGAGILTYVILHALSK